MITHWLHRLGTLIHHLLRQTSRPRRSLYGASLTLVLLSVWGVVDYERYLAYSSQGMEVGPLLSLEEYERVMVLAPHCDDEVLGAGGLIYDALQQGLQVQVVVVTNGDGHPLAAMDERGRLIPRSDDFVAMGERRQQESLAALNCLGLDPESVVFMGYPDIGLSALWWKHWSQERPYRSPLSGLSQSPYAQALRPGIPFSGGSLLEDLRTVLTAGWPDLILLPHAHDENGDHRALSAFAALAVALEQEEEPDWSPTLLSYLVHYGLYPQPRGLKLQAKTSPPRQLAGVGEWLHWPVSAEGQAAKLSAVRAYRSQLKWSRDYLYSFVRQDELFMHVVGATALDVLGVEGFTEAGGAAAAPDFIPLSGYADPVRDHVSRLAYASADIASLHIVRLNDAIWVAVDLRAAASRAVNYHLYVRAFSATDTVTWEERYRRTGEPEIRISSDRVWFQLDREALGDPLWLSITAETRQGLTLDRSAWYLFRLEEGFWDEFAVAHFD